MSIRSVRLLMSLALVSLVIVSGIVQLNTPIALAGSPYCGSVNSDNHNPITRIGLATLGSSGKIQSVTVGIGKTFEVTLDATPKDASNAPTTGKGEPQWSFEPSNLVNARKTNCFTPSFYALAPGVITIKVTQDGITSNVFTMNALQNPGTGTVPGGIGSAEDTSYCSLRGLNNTRVCFRDSAQDIDCKDFTKTYDIAKITENKQTAADLQRTEFKDCTFDARLDGSTGQTLDLRPDIEPASDLGTFISQIYNWSLSILGVVVFLSILYGGALWIIGSYNPTLISKAKNMITNAFLGALVLLSSYLILRTINPDFVGQKSRLPSLESLKSGTNTTGGTNTGDNGGTTQVGSGAVGSLCASANNCNGQLTCASNGICQRPDRNLQGDPCIDDSNCSGTLRCSEDVTYEIDNRTLKTCQEPTAPNQ